MKKYGEIEKQNIQPHHLVEIPRKVSATRHHPEHRVGMQKPKPKPKLKVLATVFHETKQESYYFVRYRTVDGASKKTFIGREMFHKPTNAVTALLKAHAVLPDDTKAAARLIKRALSKKSQRQFRITSRTGWYGNSFVYLTETFGALAGKLRHEGHCAIDPALGLSLGTGRHGAMVCESLVNILTFLSSH